MGFIHDEKTYGLKVRESATDGSDFSNPEADYRILFLGEDGVLYTRDSAGTVAAVTASEAAALAAHLADASDAHDASAISILDAGGDFTATTVEGVLDELQADNEAHVALPDIHHARSHDHATAGDGTSLSPATLILPGSATPTPTAEGSIAWDTNDDHLAIGDGAATKLIYPQLSGTWTPTLTFSTPGNLSVAYTTRLGRYAKIGPGLVRVDCEIVTSTFTHTTASGVLNVTGLPFTAAATYKAIGSLALSGYTSTAPEWIITHVGAGTTIAELLLSRSAAGIVQIQASHMPTGGSVVLYFSLAYNV